MNKRLITLLLLALLVLVACGGSDTAEPANNTTSQTEETTSTEETEPEEAEPTEEAEEDPEEETESTSDDSEEMTEEDASNEEMTEEDSSQETSTEALPMSGTDPETGLAINPEKINPGDMVIVRGEIVSMNLTPTTSPEFVMQAPSGVRYRIRAQDLAEVYYQDGTQLEPYQYRQGMSATATVTMAGDAGLTDLGITEDFTLLNEE